MHWPFYVGSDSGRNPSAPCGIVGKNRSRGKTNLPRRCVFHKKWRNSALGITHGYFATFPVAAHSIERTMSVLTSGVAMARPSWPKVQ